MIWSIILAGIGILGVYLAGKKNALGWAVGLAAQVLWIVYGIATGQLGFIASALVYGFFYGKNWLAWRKPAGPSPLDKVYRERAELLAVIARAHVHRGHSHERMWEPSAVIIHGADPDAPEWPVLYIRSAVELEQLSWHINPDDLDLFWEVPQLHGVPSPWDGHDDAEKSERLARVALCDSHDHL